MRTFRQKITSNGPFIGHSFIKLSSLNVIKKIKPLTVLQLKKWGVLYHKLYFGKPSYDLFIDDKAMFFKKNWSTILRKKKNI